MKPLNRRHFLRQSGTAAMALAAAGGSSFSFPRPMSDQISLATWSLVRSFRAGVWKLTDIHRICREDFGIDGVEYVTSFFEVPVANYLDQLNRNSEEYGIENVLIMVDGEGDMVSPDREERLQAAVNHRKWIEIADYLGCHAIRCNARGGGDDPVADPGALDRAAESFGALLDYAEDFGINVVIENHGGLSSDPDWLPDLMELVDSPHFGILPDYGNYHGDADIVDAVERAMPYAKGVSVKAGWQIDGTHPTYDVKELLRVSRDSGYSGFWGIESSIRRPRGESATGAEATKKDDWQAVQWTKEAIEQVVFI